MREREKVTREREKVMREGEKVGVRSRDHVSEVMPKHFVAKLELECCAE